MLGQGQGPGVMVRLISPEPLSTVSLTSEIKPQALFCHKNEIADTLGLSTPPHGTSEHLSPSVESKLCLNSSGDKGCAPSGSEGLGMIARGHRQSLTRSPGPSQHPQDERHLQPLLSLSFPIERDLNMRQCHSLQRYALFP